MATQQAQFAETIRAMKVALKRRPSDSDSETSIHAPTNRGHKLRKSAKHVREGRLDSTGGLAWRKSVTHAGYTRRIVARNPVLHDADGDVYEAGDLLSEDERGREAEAVEDDAFGSVRLEELLRPLTAASELPEHPSLSVAYKSKAVTQMAEEALEMVRREKAVLWKAKRLLQRFRGDADWVPCEVFETEQDEVMLLSGHEGGEVPGSAVGSVPDIVEAAAVEMEHGEGVGKLMKVDGGAVDGVEAMDMALQQAAAEAEKTEAAQTEATDLPQQGNIEPDTTENGAPAPESDPKEPTNLPPTTTLENPPDPPADPPSEQTSLSAQDPTTTTNGNGNGNGPSHAMTTRARARSPIASTTPPSPTPSSNSTSILQIHPWFQIPPSALPDRDLGLPSPEAEESRRLLLLYVQKQEQVVRSLTSLYTGLQRADRLRREVFRNCKAEGHVRDDGKGNGNVVTEMSDGEDWYDVEDWGLGKADLKVGKDGVLGLEKGKDEVEDGAEEEGRRGGRRRRVNRM